MKVAALCSGGKDSIFSIYITQQFGWEVTHLITLLSKNKDSWMFHSINIQWMNLIAKAIRIPLISRKTKGEKEEEVQDLKQALKQLPVDGIISGAIASEYQRTRIEEICHDLNLKSFTPLWHKNQELLLRDQIRAGFRIMIVGVSASGLNEIWLGKMLTEESLTELHRLQQRHHFNIGGEGGEYETITLNGPLFQQGIVLDNCKKEWKRDHGFLSITQAHLE